ncbi:hypothetical protein xavtCFBP7764_05325 [Xanthomonas citri]|nr:hypothetical protein xavtCFBP7764_05325 [Xanthomonas citri]
MAAATGYCAAARVRSAAGYCRSARAVGVWAVGLAVRTHASLAGFAVTQHVAALRLAGARFFGNAQHRYARGECVRPNSSMTAVLRDGRLLEL